MRRPNKPVTVVLVLHDKHYTTRNFYYKNYYKKSSHILHKIDDNNANTADGSPPAKAADRRMTSEEFAAAREEFGRQTLDNLQNVILKMLKKGDVDRQVAACAALMEMLQQAAAATFLLVEHGEIPPERATSDSPLSDALAAVVLSGVADKLLKLLKKHGADPNASTCPVDLQISATQVLTNVAVASDECAEYIFMNGGVDCLGMLLYSPDKRVQAQALAGLANLSGSGPGGRLAVVANDKVHVNMFTAVHRARHAHDGRCELGGRP